MPSIFGPIVRRGSRALLYSVLTGVAILSQAAQANLVCDITNANVWNNGYQLDVTVSNDGSDSVNQWALNLEFDQSAQITNSWNVELSGTREVSASNVGHNGNLAPGESTSFGFQGSHSGNFVVPSCNDANTPDDTNSSSVASSASSSSEPASASSRSATSSSEASSASSEPENVSGEAQCDWYGTRYALCDSTASGWGWESGESCIAPSTCESQPSPWGIVGDDNGNDSSAPASSSSSQSSSSSSASSSAPVSGGAVSRNGALRISGGTLVNDSGSPYQLRGMSTHGLQWYGELANIDSIRWLRDDWNINVIRAAMYTSSEGYIEDPSVAQKVWEVVDAAIELDIYVIIDWHILEDNDPNIYKDEAIDFFAEAAERYAGVPNVLYEIANEPNPSNGDVGWSSHVKPYAEEVIPAIRQRAPESVVLVGTPTWSQDVDIAAGDPLNFNNVAYAVHFYSCTHGQYLRDKVSTALSQGIAVFSTEWGNSEATGDGEVCIGETDTWLDFFDNNNISWVNWSLTTKEETSAALQPGASSTGGWSSGDLTPSGQYVRERLRRYDD